MPSTIWPASCFAFLNELTRFSPNSLTKSEANSTNAPSPAAIPNKAGLVTTANAASIAFFSNFHDRINDFITPVMSNLIAVNANENPLNANVKPLIATPTVSSPPTIPTKDMNNAPFALIQGRIASSTTFIPFMTLVTIGSMASPMVVNTETTDCLS